MLDVLDRIVRRAVFDSGYQSPEEWLIDALGGQKTDTGVRVNYGSAMTYAYVFAATQIIAGDVASLPLNVYDIQEDGDKIVNRRHPAQWVLNGSASDYMAAYTLRETLQAHALLHGNGYAAIEWDGSNRPRRLILIDPTSIEPVFVDGELSYRLNGRDELIPSTDILHIRGLGQDGIKGHSVIALARNTIAGGLASQKHGNSYFAKGGKPSVVLKTQKKLEAEEAENLLAMWESRHSSEQRPALAAGGLEVMFAPMSNEDSQWLESRKFSRVEVAAWFNLPPHKLGDDSKVSYNSLESENRSYVAHTLRRWFGRWNSECTAKLIQEPLRRTFRQCIEHDPTPLIDSDMGTQADVISKLRASEIITGNEGRRMLRLPSRPDGDTISNPNVRSPASGQPATQDPAPSAPAATASIRRLVVDRVAKLLNVEASKVTTAAGRPKFMSWIDEHRAGWTAKVEEALAPVIDVVDSLEMNAGGITASDMASRLVDGSAQSLLDAAGRVVAEDALPQEIATTVAGWPARAEVAATWLLG